MRRPLVREPVLRLLAVTLLLVAGGASAAEPRAMYRITPAKGQRPDPLFGIGLDLAGYGPGMSLDFALTASEVTRARSLGFEPVPLAAARGGPLAAASAKPNLGAYHTYSEALAEMATYASAHPAIARLDTIGTSLEGRAIVAIKISDNAAVEEGEPEALVVGCHHARELMSVEIPLYLMRRLLDGYGVDPVLTALIDTRQIWIVPVVNPDGYVYVEEHATGQSDGWWRKNRRPNSDGSFGVDLNRNYGYEWGHDDIGSSSTPSVETYRGTGPFSEPEAAAIRDFMDAHAFTLSLSFHSYGDLVLYPWGYDRLDTPDHPVFFALGDSMATQNGYRSGNPKSNAIYITNGDMDDWVYGETLLKPRLYGFTFEVNTADEGGFDPAESLIGPTCELNWGPMLTLLRYADEPRRVLGPPRPSNLRLASSGGVPILSWSYPAPDPANPVVGHDVRRITQVLRVADDAESGVADWDSVRFTWTTARSESGAHSYYSGSGDNLESILTGRASLDVGNGDSVVAWARWDLESGYDYWYCQASTDGGATWHSLAGNVTTNINPSGQNEGFGVTGSSGGGFARTAFSLLPFIGHQAVVRFRCVTDGTNHQEGLYVDDIAPTARYTGAVITDTESPDSSYAVDPPPSAPVWLTVRGVDGEGQPSFWSDRILLDPSVTAVLATGEGPAADGITGIAPNPMNPRSRVRFTLASGRPGPYRIDAFDAAGRWVGRIAEGVDSGAGGARQASWDGRDRSGRDLPSGVYFLRLGHGATSRVAKMTLLR